MERDYPLFCAREQVINFEKSITLLFLFCFLVLLFSTSETIVQADDVDCQKIMSGNFILLTDYLPPELDVSFKQWLKIDQYLRERLDNNEDQVHVLAFFARHDQARFNELIGTNEYSLIDNAGVTVRWAQWGGCTRVIDPTSQTFVDLSLVQDMNQDEVTLGLGLHELSHSSDTVDSTDSTNPLTAQYWALVGLNAYENTCEELTGSAATDCEAVVNILEEKNTLVGQNRVPAFELDRLTE
jgi:hypothetical protein